MNKIIRCFLYWFFIGFTFSSCTSVKRSEQDILFDQIANEYIDEMYANEGLKIYGSGGGMKGGPNHDKINLFVFCFESPKLTNIETARIVTLNCVQRFLHKIEVNKVIHSQLEFYPFNKKALKLTLRFPGEVSDECFHESKIVNTVFFLGDRICYGRRKSDGWSDKIFEESYEDALRIAGYQ